MFKRMSCVGTSKSGGVGLRAKSSYAGPSEWVTLKLLVSPTAGVSGNVKLGVGSSRVPVDSG